MKSLSRTLKNFSIALIISFFSISVSNATDADGTATLTPLSANPAPIPSVAGSIGTLFGTDNGGDPGGGIYFEIENVGAVPVTISSWDINTNDQTTVNVWTRPGTYSGFEQASAGWTLLGTDSTVVAQGTDQPTPVAVGGLTINPGEIYGIAMEGDGAWLYTNGTGTNQIVNNGVLELRLGSANNVAFSSSIFSPRVWNGVVYYDVGAVLAPPTPVPSLSFWGLLFLTLTLLSFETRKIIK